MATNASGFFKADYSSELGFWETPWRRFWVLAGLALAAAFPFFAPTFWIGVVNLAAIAAIGALALNLVTGYTGQLSLGHSGFLAAGAFTVGILVGRWAMPVWVTLPAAIVVGMGVGVFVGVPALRLRGIYLSISTLAAYFVIASLATEYQSRFGGSTGVVIQPPQIGSWVLSGERNWYFVLLVLVALATLLCLNLNRSHVGRAWLAIRERDLAASAWHRRFLLQSDGFVISTAMTSLAGALLAYYTHVSAGRSPSGDRRVPCDDLIGGLGSVLGSLGALLSLCCPFWSNARQLLPATFKTHLFAVRAACSPC